MCAACGESEPSPAKDPGADIAVDTGVDPNWQPNESAKIGALKFGPPLLWASPLKDYHALGDKTAVNGAYLRGIHDLAVFLDRLYVGYGDANINLGSKQQLAIRYFGAWNSAATTDEFKHDEEQIDRFRLLGDELWIAGVDATEDGWLGNVYRHAKDKPWVKLRTVQEGVHVHDIARFQGDLYAVGSGSKQAEWANSDIYAHLWRSKDDGATWQDADKEWNEGKGDARFTNLVPAGGKLLTFGYKTKQQGNQSVIASVPNKAWDGKTAAFLGPEHPLRLAWIVRSWSLTDASGLVVGRDLLQGSDAPLVAWLVTANTAKPLDAWKDETVIDMFHNAATGEFIVLSHDGAKPGIDFGGFQGKWHVRVTSDFVKFADATSFHASLRLDCLAFWHGALFFGTEFGDVYRATGS